MPYAILRFQKRKAGGVAACERHNERKKEAYKATQISTWNALKITISSTAKVHLQERD